MSFNYVIGETQRENLKDGDYTATVRNVEEKIDKFGTYVEFEYEILHPSEYAGRIETERFYVGSDNEKRCKMAKWQLSLLCKQLSGLKTGDAVSGDILLDKTFIMTVKNNIGENGKVYQNTVNRILLPNVDEKIEKPVEAPVYKTPLNDDVPF